MASPKSFVGILALALIAAACSRSQRVWIDIGRSLPTYEILITGDMRSTDTVHVVRLDRTRAPEPLCGLAPLERRAVPRHRIRYSPLPLGFATEGALPCRPLSAGAPYAVFVADGARPVAGTRFELDAAGDVVNKRSL